MKKVFILQNSLVSFGLDVRKMHQPSKYELHLIINSFGEKIVKNQGHENYYKSITILQEFTLEAVVKIINEKRSFADECNVVTNSEETMPICGEVRKYLNLDQQDYSRFFDKHVMKEKIKDNKDIFIPQYVIFDKKLYQEKGEKYLRPLVKNISIPFFVKPTCMYSSINIKKIDSYQDLCDWASYTPPGIYEIDEYIDGTMYHVDSFIKDNRILFSFVCQNSNPCYDFTIGKMKGTISLPREDRKYIEINAVAEKVLYHLGSPRDGVTHMEVIQKNNGNIYFVEIAHRSPGCLIPKMHQTNFGIDTIASHFLLQIDPDYMPELQHKTYSAWACYPKIPGVIRKLHELPAGLSSECDVDWLFSVGEEIKTYSTFGRDYIGTLFMKNKNFEKLYQEFIELNRLNLSVIE